jgi:hypothetical protein
VAGPHVEHTLPLSRSSYSASRSEIQPPGLSLQNPYIFLRILSIKLLLEEMGEWERRMGGH